MLSFFGKSILTAGAVAALAAAVVPGVASAGEVHNRIARQQARIDQGVRSGQLTYREYAHDQSALARVRFARRFDLRHDGGRLTAFQYHNLNRELNGNSRRIYYTKHNIFRQ